MVMGGSKNGHQNWPHTFKRDWTLCSKCSINIPGLRVIVVRRIPMWPFHKRILVYSNSEQGVCMSSINYEENG